MSNKQPIKVLSLFDGMSCMQIALKEIGYPVDTYYASEIDKHAIAQTQYNFPDTIQLGDVTKWREWDIDWSTIDLIGAGSPCFVAGTKVLTIDGYKEIQNIVVGDLVLTHTGNFRKVLRVGGNIKPTLTLKAQGVLKTCVTGNHPYYVREMTRVWDNKTYVRKFAEPKWKPVSGLKKGDFIGVNILQQESNPYNLTHEEAFIIGRYIADGHTRKDYRVTEGRPNDRQWQLILSIGTKKVDNFLSNISLNYSCYAHTTSTSRIVFSNKRLVEIVEKDCGCGAINKQISTTLLSLPTDLLKSLLDGYFSGDGSFNGKFHKATTISENLALSLCLAISKVYRVNANIDFTKRNSTCVIEGRTVKQHDTFTIYYRDEIKKQTNAEIIDNIVWMPFHSLTERCVEPVFNLEVEADNSYTANNAIVHNCQGFSFAGKQLAFDDPRSKLFFVFVDILNHITKFNPNVKFLLENVRMKAEHEAVISQYTGVNPLYINSALVSAQNRERIYWCNIGMVQSGLFGEWYPGIPQPEDIGILLRDILESEVDEKYYLSEKVVDKLIEHKKRHKEQGHGFGAVFHKPEQKMQALKIGGKGFDDLVCVAMRGRNPDNPSDRTTGAPTEQRLEPKMDGKTNCLTSVQKDNLVMQLNQSKESGGRQPYQQNRFYDTDGISPALIAQMSCGSHAVAIPCDYRHDEGIRIKKDGKTGTLLGRARNDESCGQMAIIQHGRGFNKGGLHEYKSPVLTSNSWEQNNHLIKDYRIRRLTPTECARLQTIPEWYKWNCSDTQIYKMLGNGWTVEVIKHILKYLTI